MRELPPGFEPYKLFHYENKDVAVCIRPEDARGWQTYKDDNDLSNVWTVVITLKDNIVRLKLSEVAARDLVQKLSDFVAADTARGVRNSLLFRRKGE